MARQAYDLWMSDLYPFLAVKDVDAAVGLYARAFGAIEPGDRVRAPDGPQVALLLISGHRVGVATEAPELATPSPETVGATTVRVSAPLSRNRRRVGDARTEVTSLGRLALEGASLRPRVLSRSRTDESAGGRTGMSGPPRQEPVDAWLCQALRTASRPPWRHPPRRPGPAPRRGRGG
jgi:hypothetical protein